MSEEEIIRLVEHYQKYREQRSQLQKVLDELSEIIHYARSCIYDWEQIDNLFANEKEFANTSYIFFINSLTMNLDSAILHCSKLLENGDSVNIQYALNLIKNQPRKFFHRDVIEDVKREVDSDFKWYSDLLGKNKSIKEIRDKEIAHRDKVNLDKRWNEPSSVSPIEIAGLLDAVENILHKYYELGGWPIPPNFEQHKSSIQKITKNDFGLDNIKYLFSIAFDNLPESAPPKLIFLKEERNKRLKSS